MFLYQEESGFLFNSDAHFLYDFTSGFKPKGDLLDIGSGCGIIGLLAARDFPISLTLIDKQKQNAKLSKINADVNALDATMICDDFLTHTFKKKFDFILSNPPYYHGGASESEKHSVIISKSNHHLPFEEMIQKINAIIKPKGHFIFCYDAKQITTLLVLLEKYKFNVENIRFVHGKANKPAHLVMIHTRKGSKALTKIEPPLVNFQDSQPTDEVKSIYQKTRTYSIKCKTL